MAPQQLTRLTVVFDEDTVHLFDEDTVHLFTIVCVFVASS